MRKFIVVLVLISFASVGCTGSFMLTKKVYNWHRGLGEKWSDEFGFLVCSLLPIYGLSTLADSLVFNSIEFWTGHNPVSEAKVETQKKFVKSGDEKAMMSYNAQANELKIASEKKGLHPIQIALEKKGNTVITKDGNGGVLYTTTKTENGDYLVYNRDSKLIKSYSQGEIRAIEKKFVR